MKIIKRGSGAKGWSKKVTCTGSGNGSGGCCAKLLIEQDDLFLTHRFDYGGGHDVFCTFCCQECGVLTDIDHPCGGFEIPEYAVWKKAKASNKSNADAKKIVDGILRTFGTAKHMGIKISDILSPNASILIASVEETLKGIKK